LNFFFTLMPSFYDLIVHAYPETEPSAAELLDVAKRYGYAGIAITNHDAIRAEQPGLPELFTGVEIQADSVTTLKRKVKHHWGKVDLIVVHGGTEKINRAAVEHPLVDILAHPCGEKGEGGLNHVLVRFAAANGVAIDFNLDALIHTRRADRARVLSKMREILRLVRKYHAPMILTSHARSVYDLRAPREMIALAALLGMTAEEAKAALSDTPAGILAKRWKKESEVEVLY
jgi:ribonuclease P/MRP protein subunit RPP1